MRRFIISTDPSNEAKLTWHYAVKRLARGQRTGRVLHRFFSAACGARLRSAYGSSVREFPGVPEFGEVCQRCARLKTVPADEQE